MPDLERLRELLDAVDFQGLLIGELGWDNPPEGASEVSHDEDGTTALLVAIKRGVGVWAVDGIPLRPAQRRLDALVAKQTRERLLVFVEAGRQVWLWPEQRPSGAGYRLVAHEHFAGTKNEALLQRLAGAAFTIGEEASLTVMDVLERVRRSFDAEKVTKDFYREFKAHRDELLTQIEGVEAPDEVAWYGSVLLNRLMLVYFLQKKGFLDDDFNYLEHRLRMVREHLGEDAFYGFFRDFLLPLFHDGLGSHLQDYDDPAIAEIVGDVPYINGGIFFEHSLESVNDINVPDSAFEAIFAFFDQFRWHLDERPTDNPNEINPDVLGYVFEQYVNSKEMGAYYTKEDVTGYMTEVTLLPAYLDRLELAEGEPWVLLSVDPDRYIYDSVRHGADMPLPPEVEDGLDYEDQRDSWWEKATPDLGLPGENWWEVVDRRRRHDELREMLSDGGVGDVSTCITENLDIRTLVMDHLDQLPDIESVEQAYGRLSEIAVLDPTCGSGAFLFAALEILADLYMTLIERAQELVETGSQVPGFLHEAQSHPNLRYFVLRSAQLNNLYGVDIMAEAGEIARLRLFLKLAAQLEHRDQIEPFPDLDLNIKCGNLLVGIADQTDAERRFGLSIIASAVSDRIAGAVEDSADVYEDFVAAQARSDAPEVIRGLKETLREQSDGLRAEADRMLHEMRTEEAPIGDWVASHQPFHWFIEFPRVFRAGGFDVVVGNPPYVARSKIDYVYSGFENDRARDIFAPCMERAAGLANEQGRFSMIVPVAFQFSNDYGRARSVIGTRFPLRWVTTYSRNPAALFPPGIGVRPCIVVGAQSGQDRLCTSNLRRWPEDYRPHLFKTTCFSQLSTVGVARPWPRPGPGLVSFYESLTSTSSCVGNSVRKHGPSLGFKKIALYYLSVYVDEPPSWALDGTRIAQTAVGELRFANESHRDVAMVLLAGRIGTWWWAVTGDDFNVPYWVLESFPIGLEQLTDCWTDLVLISQELREEQQSQPLVTTYDRKEMGNYDMSRCRHITDIADQLVLETLGFGQFWPEIMLADAQFAKATGERPGTRREWPFPL